MQNSLKQDIQKLVDGFASDLERLVRQAAVRAVSDALGAPAAAAAKPAALPAKSGLKRNKKAAKATAKAAAPRAAKAAKPASASAKSKTRIRRNDSQIDGLANQIHEYVTSHPGQRAEQIKSALKISSNNWGLPIKRLLDSGRLAAKGEKRATTYTRGVARPGK